MASTSSSPQWFTAALSHSSCDSNNGNSSPYFVANKNKSFDSSSRTSLAKMVDVSPKKRRNQRGPVKFNDRCDTHELESLQEDPNLLWFSKREIQELREEGRRTLNKVNEAGGDLSLLNESIGESIRGLEHGLSVCDNDGGCWNAAISATEDVKRSQRRKNIVTSILAQQEEQREMGISDPKGLKQCSMAYTQWAHDRALDQAQKDFGDAVQVWREDAECAKLLPDILCRTEQQKKSSTRRVGVLSMARAVASTDNERKATLEIISQAVASALEELDDLEF